ncbi:hypothetical protein AHAS_Ahas19G0335100 [Arachis hypogaea]
MASSTAKKIVSEIPTWIRVYDDGTVERPRSFPLVLFYPTLISGARNLLDQKVLRIWSRI